MINLFCCEGVNIAFQQNTIEIPDKVLLAEKTDAESFGHEIWILAALKLFEIGRLSSGHVSELAGISRVEFLLRLNSYKVFYLPPHDQQRYATDAKSAGMLESLCQKAGVLGRGS